MSRPQTAQTNLLVQFRFRLRRIPGLAIGLLGKDLRPFVQQVVLPVPNLRGVHAIFAGDLAHGLGPVRRFQGNLELEVCLVLSSLLARFP